VNITLFKSPMSSRLPRIKLFPDVLDFGDTVRYADLEARLNTMVEFWFPAPDLRNAWMKFVNYYERTIRNSHATNLEIARSYKLGGQATHAKLLEIFRLTDPSVSNVKGKTVVDLCSGAMGFARVLNKLGADPVYAMDSENKALYACPDLVQGRRVVLAPTKLFSLYEESIWEPKQSKYLKDIMDFLLTVSIPEIQVAFPQNCAHLVVGDGYKSENLLEMHYLHPETIFRMQQPLLVSQLLVALHTVKRGGNIILKYMSFPCSGGEKTIFIQLLACFIKRFNFIQFVKPPSSLIFNYERYFILGGYKGTNAFDDRLVPHSIYDAVDFMYRNSNWTWDCCFNSEEVFFLTTLFSDYERYCRRVRFNHICYYLSSHADKQFMCRNSCSIKCVCGKVTVDGCIPPLV
jgi:hypothetical protein